ncbi:hypothetical protein BDM02DRAFT_3131481, partial [Thelephora ganbajun]
AQVDLFNAIFAQGGEIAKFTIGPYFVARSFLSFGYLFCQPKPAPELSQSLQAQQVPTQNMIQLLKIKATRAKVDDQHDAHQAAIKETVESMRVSEQEQEKERESLTEMINEWKKEVEGKWVSVQEEWSVKKDCLRHARDEWELKIKTIEDGTLARVESHLSIEEEAQRIFARKNQILSQIATPPANTDSDEDEKPVPISNNGSATSPRSWPRSRTTDESTDSETHADNRVIATDTNIDKGEGHDPISNYPRVLYVAQYSAALGVVLLSVAAAAVIWRVKPERTLDPSSTHSSFKVYGILSIIVSTTFISRFD